MCLLSLSASHSDLAANLPSDIRLALFGAEVYGLSITVLPLASRAKLARQSAYSFPGMLDDAGTQWMLVAMLCVRRLCALLLIRLASRCPGPGSKCAACQIAACESLKTATIFAPCIWNFCLFSIATSSPSPIAHSSASKTSIHQVPRMLLRDLHSFPCLHTAAAPTWPSSERDPSVHHIQTPVPILASFSLAQRCAALSAAAVSSSMVVLTAGSSLRAGQFMPLVVRPCSCGFMTTLHIGAPEAGLLCSSYSLVQPSFCSLTANRCCLECKHTGAGVSPNSLISAPRGVVGCAPRMDQACRLRRSRRSSRLPTSLGSHQNSVPYSATAWTRATWTARTLSGTTPYFLVSDRSLASAALAFFMHPLWCALNVRCACIQTPSQRVACALNRMDPLPTSVSNGSSFGPGRFYRSAWKRPYPIKNR